MTHQEIPTNWAIMFYLAQAVFSYSFFLLSHLFCLNKYMADMNMPKSICNGDAKKLKNYF